MENKFLPGLLFLAGAVAFAADAHATPTVWDGPLITFFKPGFTDWTLEENQDRITDAVWLTRAGTEGIFNIRTEPFYTHNESPSDTEWAFGTTAEYDSLLYQPWEVWCANRPVDLPNKDAVLHLISEDIYIDIKFTTWGRAPSGGSFSYVRSTIPEPGSTALLGIGGLLCIRRRRAFLS